MRCRKCKSDLKDTLRFIQAGETIQRIRFNEENGKVETYEVGFAPFWCYTVEIFCGKCGTVFRKRVIRDIQEREKFITNAANKYIKD